MSLRSLEESEHGPRIMSELQNKVNFLRQKYGTTQALVKELDQLFYDFRSKCKNYGVDFPVMRCIVLPSVAEIYCLPAELDRKAIEAYVVNICTENPTVDMVELAVEMARAYPSIKLSQLN